MTSIDGRNLVRAGAGVAVATGLLQLWMNLAVGLVGEADNAVNQGFYGVVVAAAACAFTARFEAAGMARAMLATAGVQALLGLAVATAPSTPQIEPMGAGGVVMLSGMFVTLWLVAAGLFWRGAGQAAAME